MTKTLIFAFIKFFFFSRIKSICVLFNFCQIKHGRSRAIGRPTGAWMLVCTCIIVVVQNCDNEYACAGGFRCSSGWIPVQRANSDSASLASHLPPYRLVKISTSFATTRSVGVSLLDRTTAVCDCLIYANSRSIPKRISTRPLLVGGSLTDAFSVQRNRSESWLAGWRAKGNQSAIEQRKNRSITKYLTGI